MNLIRFLVIAAIIWLSFRIYQNWKQAKVSSKKKARTIPIEDMVQCSKCGVHLPENEALKSGNKFFCSESHKN